MSRYIRQFAPNGGPNWQSEPLTPIEFHVLAELVKAPSHAYELARQIIIDSDERFAVTVAGISYALKRMAGVGWVEPAADTAGAPRRTPRAFRLTAEGTRQLEVELMRMNRIAGLVERWLADSRG